MANLFKGYQEVVNMTAEVVALGDLSNKADVVDVRYFMARNNISKDSMRFKKYMHIMRALGYNVKCRKGVWYLNNLPL